MFVRRGSIVLLLVLMFPAGGRPQAPPGVRMIPGLTAPDAFPRGCVDCHVNRPDMKKDARFSTMMKQWAVKVDPKLVAKLQPLAPKGVTLKGKHPAVALKDVPAGCLKCHGETSRIAPSLSQMSHVLHLAGGKESVFLTVFQGECTHCHKLAATTGTWTLPSGPEK